MTPFGIEPATFRFVAQYLNHCANAVPYYIITKTKLNSVALVRERTIPTERPLPVGEVSAYFCGYRGVTWLAQRFPTAVNLCFLNLKPLLFYSSSSSV